MAVRWLPPWDVPRLQRHARGQVQPFCIGHINPAAVPLNDSARRHTLPLVDQVVFQLSRSRTLPVPEKSVTDVPMPSLKPKATTKPVGAVLET